MYRSFELRITDEESKNIIENAGKLRSHLWHSLGFQRKVKIENEYKELLKKYVEYGTVNGTELAKEVFAQEHYDVFLSYSHNDKDLIYIIAGLLEEQFDLKVFVDTFYWGHADSLLKEIDDINCKQPDGTYNYAKRNLSTSHVHAMLTSAIIQIMDSSEIVIFINTDNSVPVLQDTLSGIKKYTFSPWIYEEVLLTKYLRERNWTEYRQILFQEKYHFNKSDLEIKYELPNENLITLDVRLICEWMNIYNKLNSSNTAKIDTMEKLNILFTFKVKHPLNILYKLIESK